MDGLVEDGRHVPHVADGEDGVQQLPLLAVVLAYAPISLADTAMSVKRLDLPRVESKPSPKILRLDLDVTGISIRRYFGSFPRSPTYEMIKCGSS